MFEIMKMLQLGSAKNVDITAPHHWIDGSFYDTILANQPAPRVLTTRLPTFWLPENFR